ncbi:hypothetical protein SAMN05421813_101180 [Daejeonella rubra]|uniref:Uncharacterized protein n=1 Tax=Daejeonella rubra TaxID=990371 RepID=A0A1G9M1P8_9SPHI|nr:hypothetical protein [Daejeonella rubra]SDL67847.1 hypothetical protein SAMN05421813_101180 [Daejeonella rubra]
MNTKTLIIGIAGGIVVFLTGFLIYGVLMMEYFVSNMSSFPGFTKDPMEIWAIAAGNIIWGILLAYVFNLGGLSSGGRGALHGAILFFLFSLGMNIVSYGQYNLYSLPLSLVDALCMAILGCTGGAFTGWLLCRTSTKTA